MTHKQDIVEEVLKNQTSMSIYFRVNAPCEACGAEKTEGGEFSCDLLLTKGDKYKVILCAGCISQTIRESK